MKDNILIEVPITERQITVVSCNLHILCEVYNTPYRQKENQLLLAVYYLRLSAPSAKRKTRTQAISKPVVSVTA